MNKPILLAISLMLAACMQACTDDYGDTPEEQGNNTESAGNNIGSADPNTTGTVTAWKDGYITFYGQPSNNDSYPWPLPEMEKGYYNVAPGVHFFPNYILGSAYEIQYGNKTIRVIGKDICPDGDNSWFDNTPEAFEYLTGNKALGKVNVKWRETPYYTNKNVVVKIKNGSNNWFLGLFVFNGRYGVSKVEVSADGKTFHAMKPFTYNAFWELQCPFDQYNKDLTIRLTDRYGHVVTGQMKMTGVKDGTAFDMGKNFEY